jgi:hypothetical protein
VPLHACPAGRARAAPAPELGDIARQHLGALLREPLGDHERAVVRALVRCRTAELGGHLDVCAACGHDHRPMADLES